MCHPDIWASAFYRRPTLIIISDPQSFHFHEQILLLMFLFYLWVLPTWQKCSHSFLCIAYVSVWQYRVVPDNARGSSLARAGQATERGSSSRKFICYLTVTTAQPHSDKNGIFWANRGYSLMLEWKGWSRSLWSQPLLQSTSAQVDKIMASFLGTNSNIIASHTKHNVWRILLHFMNGPH